MSRNAEHYADPTPCAAFRSMQKDERQKEAAKLLQISLLVPLLRQVAEWAENWTNPVAGQGNWKGVSVK